MKLNFELKQSLTIKLMPLYAILMLNKDVIVLIAKVLLYFLKHYKYIDKHAVSRKKMIYSHVIVIIILYILWPKCALVCVNQRRLNKCHSCDVSIARG